MNSEAKQEVLFIRLPKSLKENVEAAAKQYGKLTDGPKRRGNVNRMVVALLEEKYAPQEATADGS